MAMPDPDPMKPADLAAHRPPAWLRGGHLQTLWPAVITPRAQVALRRERWTTPDADFIEVDRVDSPAGMRAPLVHYPFRKMNMKNAYSKQKQCLKCSK